MAETVYNGVYEKLRGVPMSMAFASTLNISFDVRGGLLIRQIHHWAALLFVFSMMLHMMRIFFTGAFRKPREVNCCGGTGRNIALSTLPRTATSMPACPNSPPSYSVLTIRMGLQSSQRCARRTCHP